MSTKFFQNIIKDKNFKIKPLEVYSKISLSFLKDFSFELRQNKNMKNFPDLIYLMYWCNECLKSIKKNNNDFLSLGRGLAFHICPSNVPTNFIYSFFFGLLSGNSNIIKMPSKHFKEKEIILSVVKKLFKKKNYKELRETNKFIEYSNKDEVTKFLSSKCDVRIIWGGDKTINTIRKHWIPEKAVDITFADRYSFTVINLDKLKENRDIFSTIRINILNMYNGDLLEKPTELKMELVEQVILFLVEVFSVIVSSLEVLKLLFSIFLFSSIIVSSLVLSSIETSSIIFFFC